MYDDNGQLIREYDEQGNPLQLYVWLENMPLAMLDSSGIHYLHTDHLHTPRVATDATGAISWQADYTPFGEVTETVSQIEMNLRFPGQYHDRETGLHQNWHREYAPHLGRYTQSDPIGLLGGINLYNYAYGNPNTHFDSFGLWPITQRWRSPSASCYCKPSVELSGQGGIQAIAHVVAFGASVSAGVSISSKGDVCLVRTICGRIGPGLFAGFGGYVGGAVAAGPASAGPSTSIGIGGDVGFGAGVGAQVRSGQVNSGQPRTASGIRGRGGAGYGFSAGIDFCFDYTDCRSVCE